MKRELKITQWKNPVLFNKCCSKDHFNAVWKRLFWLFRSCAHSLSQHVEHTITFLSFMGPRRKEREKKNKKVLLGKETAVCNGPLSCMPYKTSFPISLLLRCQCDFQTGTPVHMGASLKTLWYIFTIYTVKSKLRSFMDVLAFHVVAIRARFSLISYYLCLLTFWYSLWSSEGTILYTFILHTIQFL